MKDLKIFTNDCGCTIMNFSSPCWSFQKDRIDRRKRLIKDLTEMFQNHEQHKRIIYDDIFFINGKDKNDAEINRPKE
jgi:hypothetical protein